MRSRTSLNWIALLSLVGLGLAAYLVYLHLALMRGELVGGAVCGGEGPLNCHAVTASSWGSFLGLPLAYWGLLGYLLTFGLALLARQSEDWAGRVGSLLATLTLTSVLVDLILLVVMLVKIRFLCVYCFLTYAVNLLLLWLVWSGWLKRATRPGLAEALAALRPSVQQPATALFWGLVIVGCLGIFGVHASTLYVSRGTLKGTREQMQKFVTEQPKAAVDVGTSPVKGELDRPLQVVEFSDFFCPACQRASKMNQIILANHRDEAVFVFKHFPLDTTCNTAIQRGAHQGACQLAAASACAHKQGKFWPVHDAFFRKDPPYDASKLTGDLRAAGVDMMAFAQCMEAGEGVAQVKEDIAQAERIGVKSTPTYVIGGVVVRGGITPSTFDELVDALRSSSR